MTAKIVFVAGMPGAAETARDLLPAGYELVIAVPGSADFVEAIGHADYLVGFVDDLVDDVLYERAPRLRLIQLLSAGYNRIDLGSARRAGVPIANNGGANSVAVSEHALMLMLAVSKQLVSQHAKVAAGLWQGNGLPHLSELGRKTLGIIGLGNIGKKVARLGNAFGMDVAYNDIARLSDDAEDAAGVRFLLLGELLRDADIVTLHVPLNDGTRQMIGPAELARMKPSAILINTSRGPVIDEPALCAALANGDIAGAGLDVFDQEPPAADNPLFALPNVTLTAHVAGPTWESNAARVRNAFDNVQRVERGDAPLWVIPELRG
ncbi:MAG: 2-hydroxyacid dehydrogenase [Alphaproteobacteria bacterium]|mgnify:CR=1 FL=1